MPDMRRTSNVKLLQRVKDRYKVMSEADNENRTAAMEDMKFANVPGKQWEYNMLQQRGDRPAYEFNKVRIACKRVINDMRANRPGAKVRAVEDGDTTVAEIDEGLIRNIWDMCDGDSIIDYAAEYQVAAGMAAWRIKTEEIDGDPWTMDLKLCAIKNPFTVYVDPACSDFMFRDARDWIITEKMPEDMFEDEYGDIPKVSFEHGEHEYDDDDDWTDEKRVRIAEYWWKEKRTRDVHRVAVHQVDETGKRMVDEMGRPMLEKMMIVDGESDEMAGITGAPEKFEIVDTRSAATYDIKWVKCSGNRILDQGEWVGEHFPFIMVYGEHAWIDGRPHWWGLVRFAKDAQQAYNLARTAIAECIHQSPKVFMWATVEQAEGHMSEWREAHKKNLPVLLYNADPKNGGAPPQRVGGPDIPVALIQEAQMASDEIKAVTGIFDASYGAQSNETSGRAIYARQQQGEIVTFNFQDNMSKAVQRTYEILLALIPHVYDTQREVRVLGADGAEKYYTVNEVVEDDEGNPTRVHDLRQGKYDVTVTTGPSFSTLRQEAAETYGNMAQAYPDLMGFAGDLIFKSMDLPYAEEIAERIKVMLPPPVQALLNEDTEYPEEVKAAMAQVEQAMAAVQEQAAALEEESRQLETERRAAMGDRMQASEDQAQAELKRKDIEIAREKLLRAQAEFSEEVAQKLAGMESGLPGSDATEGLASAVASIDSTLAAFMQETDEILSGLRNYGGPDMNGGGMVPPTGTAVPPDGEDIADAQPTEA